MLNEKQIKKLNKSLDELNSLAADIEKEIVSGSEFNDRFYDLLSSIKDDVLEKDSKEWKLFDNRTQEYSYRMKPKPGSYAGQSHLNKVDDLKSTIKEVINLNSDKKSNKKEYSFDVDEKHEAERFLLKRMKAATSDLKIMDPYLDEEIFDYIDSIDEEITVKFLTGSKKKMFRKLFKSLSSKQKNIEARINNNFHDRFIIVDDDEVYALGGSINTVGKKPFMVHEVELPEEREGRINDFNEFWSKGSKAS